MISLPPIPIIDARLGSAPQIARIAEAGMRDLLREARRTLSPPALALMDIASRHWFERSDNPYAGEIDAVAEILGRPGAHALNASYEWACTSGVGADLRGGVRLLRVLD